MTHAIDAFVIDRVRPSGLSPPFLRSAPHSSPSPPTPLLCSLFLSPCPPLFLSPSAGASAPPTAPSPSPPPSSPPSGLPPLTLSLPPSSSAPPLQEHRNLVRHHHRRHAHPAGLLGRPALRPHAAIQAAATHHHLLPPPAPGLRPRRRCRCPCHGHGGGRGEAEPGGSRIASRLLGGPAGRRSSILLGGL